MKRFFVFTLTVLFATACLLLTNLSAGYDWSSGSGGNLEFVWAGSTVFTSWNFPIAKGMHAFSVYNYSGFEGYRSAIPVRYYYVFESEILGPGIDEWKKDDDGHGTIEARDWWSISQTFSFNMRGKGAGNYSIVASTDLTVKADLDGDGNPETQDGWDSSTSTLIVID